MSYFSTYYIISLIPQISLLNLSEFLFWVFEFPLQKFFFDFLKQFVLFILISFILRFITLLFLILLQKSNIFVKLFYDFRDEFDGLPKSKVCENCVYILFNYSFHEEKQGFLSIGHSLLVHSRYF